MNKRKLAGISAILVALAIFSWGGGWDWFQTKISPPSVGMLPALTLPDRTGKGHALQGFRGKRLLLHFWATWCPPCLEELPGLLDFVQKHPNLPFEVLIISLDMSWEEANKAIPAQIPPKALFLLDVQGLSAQKFGSYQYPETYILNTEGEITHKLVGPQNWKDQRLQDYILGNPVVSK